MKQYIVVVLLITLAFSLFTSCTEDGAVTGSLKDTVYIAADTQFISSDTVFIPSDDSKLFWLIDGYGYWDSVDVEVLLSTLPEEIPEVTFNNEEPEGYDFDIEAPSYEFGWRVPGEQISYQMIYKEDTLAGTFVIPKSPHNLTCNGISVENNKSTNQVTLPKSTRQATFLWECAEGYSKTVVSYNLDYVDTLGETQYLSVYDSVVTTPSFILSFPADVDSVLGNYFRISHTVADPIRPKDTPHISSEKQYVYYDIEGSRLRTEMVFSD